MRKKENQKEVKLLWFPMVIVQSATERRKCLLFSYLLKYPEVSQSHHLFPQKLPELLNLHNLPLKWLKQKYHKLFFFFLKHVGFQTTRIPARQLGTLYCQLLIEAILLSQSIQHIISQYTRTGNLNDTMSVTLLLHFFFILQLQWHNS